MKQLKIEEEQKTNYCIPITLRDEQIKINLKKTSGRMSPEDLKNEPIAIVSFGPSLKDTWPALKNFRKIMTCSGAHKFLIEKGIVPTYHVDLDPRAHKIGMLGEPHKDVKYLLASTIHPKYLDLLQGFDVKLWHIFADENEAAPVLPRGEWLVTGGSSVGLRCLTLARILGYTDMHIFGMDGSAREGASHTTDHPNAPHEFAEVEYKGKKYLTTTSMLHVAKETWRELDMMSDVKAKFYGEGLVQDMAKDYVPNPKHGSLIAFNHPELISKEYIDLNRKLHEDNPNYGMGGSKHVDIVLKLTKELKTTSVLDYGAGKMQLAKALPFPIWSYDPAVPEISQLPKPADIVICTDVLEHIEPDKLPIVLSDLKRCVKQVGYFVISTRKAVKTYSNGQNTHLIVQDRNWWVKKLNKYFNIGDVQEDSKVSEVRIVVGIKTEAKPDITEVVSGNNKLKFYTPNDVTKWRANTLLTKEPSTVEWINSMKEGEILYDVGANIGSYSVMAGVRGVKVYSFEPEAGNYALLVKNMQLNGLEANAYCMAISDREKIGVLYAGQPEVGGACHTFDEKVGYDLKHRETKLSQGTIGMPLDRLIEEGLPAPDYIKIDVDGLEYKVINGANHILSNGIKSILVEINENIEQHRQTVEKLQSMGFTYDPSQVKRAIRKEGPFKGCAEYIFTKTVKEVTNDNPPEVSSVLGKKIVDAELCLSPYPHFFIENFFPEGYYQYLIANLPEEKYYMEIEKTRGTRGYPKRFTAFPVKEPWTMTYKTIASLRKLIESKFGLKGEYNDDFLLIRDHEGYQISPHTDTPKKAVSALFYLAKDENNLQAGTNIYIPKEEGFTCNTGKHYSFEMFTKHKAFPYKPNSLLVFMRTDNSFHGVEPSDCIRDVLLYNIRNNG